MAVSFDPLEFLKNPDFPKKPENRLVLDVIDGDTIILENGEKVRYLGIDAPETHKKEDGVWINVKEPFGNEATTYNKMLVKGKFVELRYDAETKDIYNRTLAYVYVNGVMLNTKLLSEGMVFPYDITKLKEHTKFKLAFLNAVKSKRGLYKNFFIPAKLYEQIGLYGWYRGKVNSVYNDKNKVIINTDYLDIQISKKGKSKPYGINPGKICYFYGKLNRKKDRYILLSENSHHFVIE